MSQPRSPTPGAIFVFMSIRRCSMMSYYESHLSHSKSTPTQKTYLLLSYSLVHVHYRFIVVDSTLPSHISLSIDSPPSTMGVPHQAVKWPSLAASSITTEEKRGDYCNVELQQRGAKALC